MIKIYTIALILLSGVGAALAQAPQGINYQAVVRDANGHEEINTAVVLRFTIHDTLATGTNVFTETDTLATNQFGLANLSIGNGNVVSGIFNTIDWSTGNYFIKTEFDPKGGDNYTVMGTSQMMSVPYSRRAVFCHRPRDL